MGVLDGIRVLDFGRYIAGPWCAALLADFGADVIRMDKAGGSEDRFVMPVGHGLEGALFMQVNRNKRSMTLDTRGPEGKAVLEKLIGQSDVVVANMPDSALIKLGIDYASLTAIRPDVILTSVTAFGTKGPYAEKVGFDMIAQAMSGSMHLTGHAGEPMRSYVSWVDFGTATLAALGTLAALIERQKTGKGQQVQASLLQTALTTANAHLIEQALTRVNRVGSGNRNQITAPADMFRTADGHIVMQVVGDPMFRRWTAMIGEPGWADDPRFAGDEARAAHGDLLSERMQQWCGEKTTAEALGLLEKARLPAAQVLSPQQALDHEHVAAAGFFGQVRHPGSDALVPVAETPVRLSATPGTIASPAPATGQHTEEILAELGYEADGLARLRDEGAI